MRGNSRNITTSISAGHAQKSPGTLASWIAHPQGRGFIMLGQWQQQVKTESLQFPALNYLLHAARLIWESSWSNMYRGYRPGVMVTGMTCWNNEQGNCSELHFVSTSLETVITWWEQQVLSKGESSSHVLCKGGGLWVGTCVHMVDTLLDLNATDLSHSIIIAAYSSLHEYLVYL